MKQALRAWRRVVSVGLVLVVVILIAPEVSQADGGRHRHHGRSHVHRHHGVRTHVFVGVAPVFGPRYFYGSAYPWWYSPPAYPVYVPRPVYVPPPVVIQEPPVYVQQQTTLAPHPAPPPPAPAPPAPAAASDGYWYYCPGTRTYYPAVSTCTEDWVKIPASR